MFKFKIVGIVLLLCATVSGAGVTGGTVMPLYELSPHQKKILSDAVSSFEVQVNAEDFSDIGVGIVSLNGQGASVGFEVIKTGIRVDDGKSFLSITCGIGGANLVIEVEFDSVDDLFDSVGKSLLKTAKLVPYSYRRWVKGEDVDFNNYFDVFEDQRAFTIKAGGKVILESSNTGLQEFVYDGPPITDFLNLPDSLNQLPWDDDGAEDCRVDSVDEGFSSVPDIEPEPEPEPEPESEPESEPEVVVWNGFSYSDGMAMYGTDGVYRFPWVSDSLEMFVGDEGYSGEIHYNGRFLNVLSWASVLIWHDMWATFDDDDIQVDSASASYEYVKWGEWMDADVYFFSKDGAPFEVSSVRFIAGPVTPVDSIPNSGTAIYSGDVWGIHSSSDEILPVTADLTLVADFSNDSISGGFSNYRVDGVPTTSWDLDLVIGDDGLISGSMTEVSGAEPISGSVSGAFAGPNAEEVMGGWNYEDPQSYDYAAGFFAGKK